MRLSTLARGTAAAALLALAVPAAHAQIIPEINVGVAGGINFASLEDVSTLNLESSTGYHVGLYADVGVLFFSARTGLYYLWAGEVGDAVDPETVSFVTVPVDFQLQTPTPFAQLYLLAGPEFRFPLEDFEGVRSTFDKSSVNTILNVGVGVKGGLPLFGPSGFAELRYGYDATGFASQQGLGTDDGDDVRLDLVLVRIGFGI